MKARSIRELVSAVVLAVVVMTPALLVTVRAQGQQGGIPDLIGALKSTPGVLGVDAARGTMNGKTVIFAWFENKKAALAWYYSETHMAVMLQFSSGGRPAAHTNVRCPRRWTADTGYCLVDHARWNSRRRRRRALGRHSNCDRALRAAAGRSGSRGPLRPVDCEGAGACRDTDRPWASGTEVD